MEKAMTPYNFIPFPDTAIYRYKNVDELPKHDKYEEGLLSGYIEYKISTDGHIFINDGTDTDGFFKINNKYAIPGSSLRGLVRTNAEILSQSMPNFIEDRQYWYRGLADQSKKLRDQYDKALKDLDSDRNNDVEDGVSAGYIEKRDNKYMLFLAKSIKRNHTYMTVEESELRKFSFNSQNTDKYYMYRTEVNWEELARQKRNRNIRLINKILRGNKNKRFNPYQIKVYYKLDDNKKRLMDISISSKKGYKRGYLVNSSNLGNKKVHYLVFEESSKYKKVDRKVIDDFKVNVGYRHHSESKIFNVDLKGGDRKVVFYKTRSNKVDVIGFTPYLKIPYKHSIKNGIKTEEPGYKEELEQAFDYTKAIFGMTDPINYKGRVIFDNAISETPEDELDKLNVNKILSNPSPKSFQLYLEQPDGKLKNYNDHNFNLRGYKFYYLKEDIDKDEDKNRNMVTNICGIDNATFKTKVHFENLNKDELGLLLLALKPFENAKELIGQGKPYGFGKVKIELEKLEIEDRNELNNNLLKLEEFNMEKVEEYYKNMKSEEDIKGYKDIFEAEFQKRVINQTGNEDYKLFDIDNEIIDAFHYAKTVERSKRETGYMELKRFRNREVLERVSDLTSVENKGIKSLINDLRQNLTLFDRGKDLPLEERVKKYKRIVLCSKEKSEEKKLRNIFEDFENIEFKNLDEIESYNNYDIVIFNNYGGKEDEDKIEEKLKRDNRCGFVFFNNKGQRININSENLLMNYSNSKVTLYDAIMQVARLL